MDSLIQLAHLSEEDLLCLSEKTAESLAIAFDSVSHEAVEAKNRLKKSEEAHEVEVKRLSDECVRLRSELDSVNGSLNTLRDALIKKENKSLEVAGELDSLNKKLSDSLSVSSELEMVIKNLENDKESLNELLNKKIFEFEQVSNEFKELQKDVQSVRRMKTDVLTQIEEVKTEKALLALREKRLDDANESIKSQNLWLEEELHKANDKLLSVRRDNSEKLLNLESELISRKSELENAQNAISKLEDLVKQLSKSNEDHIEKLKLRTDELVNMEQMHTNELEAQRRLTELYKEQANDIEKKYEEMQKAVAEMQEMLKQGHEVVVHLQSEKASAINALMAEKEKLKSEKAALVNELNAAKEIVDKFRIQGLSEEELRQLNPAVATTIASLKRGRSLTEIYSDYVQVVEERDLLKLDKSRLTEHIREMMTQLEEKAPLLRSQQEAFYRSIDRIKELEVQLEAALANSKEKEDIAEDNRRRSGYFQRQNLLLKQSCRDLSVQVKTLLCQVEASRGTVITSTDDSTTEVFPDSSTDDIDSRKLLDLCSDDKSAAASVIDKNLVTFRSLADLQTQNARLLLVARDLATQLEDHESKEEVLSNQVSEITAKVEVLSGEVEVARLAASEARSEANLAIRERDSYKSMLRRHAIPLPDTSASDESSQKLEGRSHGDGVGVASLHQSVSVLDRGNGSMPNLYQSKTVKLEESLCSLHAEFKQYREDKVKSDEVYTETIEKLRRESTEARILNQKLAAQLDFTHEKFRTLESNVSNYKQEISILREMNARYTTSAAASDEALTALRDQAARTTDRLAATEVECRQLIRQLEQARANEARLTQELETARKSALMHEHLMHQLQSIQSNLEHRDEMETRQANRRIEALEMEIGELKRTSAEKQEQLLAVNATLHSELSHARQALRSAEDEASQLRSAIATKKPSSPTSNADIPEPSELQAQASSSSSSLHPDICSDIISGDATRSQTTHLRNLERECASLRVSLEAVRKQFDEYQQLGNEMEAHIAKLTKEREQLECVHATEIDDVSQRCELFSLQLVLEKSERQDLLNEKTRLNDEYQSSMKKLREDLASVQMALRDAEERRDSALRVETSARSEVAAHQRAAQEAREKYETELRLHSQDVQLLTEARKSADEARAEVEGLRVSLETAHTSLQKSEEQLNVQNNLWEESRTRLVKRIEDADAEINRLQEQILKLTEQIVNLRKLMENTSEHSFSFEESSSQIRESEDFMHVLQYLRRQKAIAEAAEESANTEVSRLHLRTKTLEAQISDLQAKLAEERRKSEIRLETSSQHATLMKQIEQVNLLNESNRLLRQEREMIRDTANRAEEQLAALRREMEPLRVQCKDLEDAREILAAEKRSLVEERDRWKERCTRLVETSKRMDPEEYKQACNARDQLQTRLEATEEAKAIVERESAARIAALEEQVSDLSSRLIQRESEGQSFSTELASLQSQCKIQEDELSKRQIKISKLREIGRKYRQEADELRRQLSETIEREENIKSTEEAIVAVRADLLNAEANLQIEQEQSSMLRQEIDNLQQLIDQVESLQNMEFVKDATPQSLIGTTLSTSPHASATYARLNHILSAMVAEFYRMREQAKEQSERLLRMQLIESQLAKTKRQCNELKAQVAAAVTSTPVEPPITSHPVVMSSTTTQTTEAGDHPTPLPETINSTSIAKPIITTTTSAIASWGVRAAATVQPVQTPPPPAASPGPLSAAARQMVEIRPLPSFVGSVLPTASNTAVTTAVTANLQGTNSGSSYLSPLTTQPVEATIPPTMDSQPLPSSSRTNDTSIVRYSCIAKRTYEEAILGEEQRRTSETVGEVDYQPSFLSTPSSPPNVQESKRLKTATLTTTPSTTTIPLLSMPPINTELATSIASPVATVVNREMELTDIAGDGMEIRLEDFRVVEEEEEDEDREEEEEEGEEEEEEGAFEQEAPAVDFRGEVEGAAIRLQYDGEEQDDSCLVIDGVNDQPEQLNQEVEEDEESENMHCAEENNDGPSDYETEDEDAENEDEEVDEAEEDEMEGDADEEVEGEMEQEDEEEGGNENPVIVVSSGEEGKEAESADDVDDESNAEEEEEGEDEGDEEVQSGEEERGEAEGDNDVQSSEEGEVESQNEEVEGEEEMESEMAERVQPPPATTTSESPSLFSHSSNITAGPVFSSAMPSTPGGLFTNFRPSFSADSQSTSLFGGMRASAPRNPFSGVLPPQPQHGESLIRPSKIPGPALFSAKPTTSGSVGEMSSSTSKQKIRPIVWSESSDVTRKRPTSSTSASTPNLLRPSTIGALGRRKNWTPFGGIGRGAPRGGHR